MARFRILKTLDGPGTVVKDRAALAALLSRLQKRAIEEADISVEYYANDVWLVIVSGRDVGWCDGYV